MAMSAGITFKGVLDFGAELSATAAGAVTNGITEAMERTVGKTYSKTCEPNPMGNQLVSMWQWVLKTP